MKKFIKFSMYKYNEAAPYYAADIVNSQLLKRLFKMI